MNIFRVLQLLEHKLKLSWHISYTKGYIATIPEDRFKFWQSELKELNHTSFKYKKTVCHKNLIKKVLNLKNMSIYNLLIYSFPSSRQYNKKKKAIISIVFSQFFLCLWQVCNVQDVE